MIIFIILAVLSIGYGLMIFSVASGSKFFLFWIFLGVLFLIFAVGIHRKWYLMAPKWLLILVTAIICVGAAAFIFLAARIGKSFNSRCDEPLDSIIVLGAQVRDDGPSVVLKYRLDCAADYLRANPQTVCIVTGAKGSNEPVSEARGMADYLIAAGIDEGRIILEEKARNTAENIFYSRELLPSDGTVGIVTNNFHMYRAIGIAKKNGLGDVQGISAGSTLSFLPNNMTREVIGVVKDICCGNMVFW